MTAPTVWVLLRGLTRGRHHWGDFLRTWQLEFPTARLLPIDIAGNGDRYTEISPWTIAAMVADCRAQLQASGVKAQVGVFAVSMGAMVALEWARLHPQEVNRLVLVNTSMRPFSPLFQRLQPLAWRKFFRLALRQAGPRQWEQAIAYLTSSTASEDTVNEWVRLRDCQPVSPANAMRQLAAAAQFKAPVECPAASILVLASTGDLLVSVKCSQAICEQWRLPLLLHPSAGHDLTLDDGAWVSRAVKHWLAQS